MDAPWSILQDALNSLELLTMALRNFPYQNNIADVVDCWVRWVENLWHYSVMMTLAPIEM